MNLLLTKAISAEKEQELFQKGWNLHTTEVLSIQYDEIASLPKATYAVISSSNSLPALEGLVDQLPNLLYCVGEKTSNRLKTMGYGGTLLVYSSMKNLSEALFQMPAGHILFVCGSHYRSELEDQLLQNQGFSLEKVYAYYSVQTFPKLETALYQAVTVMSPRAAESLFKNNHFSGETAFYCIGVLTAEAVRKHGYTQVFYPENPSIEDLLQLITIPIHDKKRFVS